MPYFNIKIASVGYNLKYSKFELQVKFILEVDKSLVEDTIMKVLPSFIHDNVSCFEMTSYYEPFYLLHSNLVTTSSFAKYHKDVANNTAG
jgi:hypothetical protein